MATHVQSLRSRRVPALPAAWLLARKLLQRTWGLLLIILCVMTAMISLVGSVPLLSNVALAASIQDIAHTEIGGAHITVSVGSDHPSTAVVEQSRQKTASIYSAQLGAYLDQAQFSVLTPALQMLNMQTGQADQRRHMSVLGYDFTQVGSDISVLQGRLPQPQSSTQGPIEIAVTRAVADELGLTIGSTRTVRYPIAANSVVWQLRVVGIVAPKFVTTNLWHSMAINGDATGNAEIQSDTSGNTYTVLASAQTLLPRIATIQIVQSNIGEIHSQPATTVQLSYRSDTTAKSSPVAQPVQPLRFEQPMSGGQNLTFSLYWSYPVDVARINAANLDSFLQAYDNATNQAYSLVSQNTYQMHFYIQGAESTSIARLNSYRQSLLYEQILVTFLLISIFVLALYMIGILPNIVIERQLATVAIARSRGATRRHIFSAFALQCSFAALVALVAGPVCAFLLVITIAPLFLTAADQSALQAITAHPVQSITSVFWLALLIMAFVLLVMVLALRKSTQTDLLSLRRELSRTRQKPFWKRMYLDVVLILITLTLFSYYLYFSSRNIDLSSAFGPLALLAVPGLLLSLLLLFLRIMPLLLRLGTWLAAHMRGAAGYLASAQMERQPLITLRLMIILTMALAFSVYLFSLIATQQYNTQERVRFQVGADFSGPIVATASQDHASLAQVRASYAALPGVAAATPGYNTMLSPNGYASNIIFNDTSFNAVDADTYAQTAAWSTDYTTQSLASLMSQLVAHRADASAHNVVYAIVTKGMWQNFNLSPGATFTYPTNDNHFQHVTFVALAAANALPSSHTTNDSILVDYQSYATVYAKSNPGQQLRPNYVWLAAQHTATAQEQIQHELPGLQDLSVATAQAQSTPGQLAINSTLMLGAISLLLLAIIGILLTAWLGVTRRLTSFALFRALGMAPRQISAILLWEQGITYGLALLLGLGIGWLLTRLVGPISGLLHSSSFSAEYMATRLPQHTILPYTWIGLLCALLLIVCGVTLLFTVRYAAQPSVSQRLRLNED